MSKGTFGRHPAPGDRNLWLDPARTRRGSVPAAPKPRRRLRHRAKLALGALLLAPVAAAVAWSAHAGLLASHRARLDDALALRTISVEGNHRAPAAELVEASGLTAGTPLLDIDVEAVQALVEAHPWVQRARIVRVPPSLVIVSVVEREPLAVTADEGGTPWLLDAEGRPFAQAGPDDVASLPWVAAPHPVREGVTSMELARGAALALALHGTSLAEGAEIRIAPPPDPEGLSLLVAGVRGRVVLGHGDYAEKLHRLEKLRAAALPETAAAGIIDLRFADRAVLRSAAPPEAAQHTMGTIPGGTSPPPGRRS